MLERQEIIKRFVGWAKLKARIHFAERQVFPKEREIWWVSLGQNIGVEINGKHENFERPVLVIKRFNVEAVLILPISSRIKNDQYHWEFTNSEGNLNTINLSQVRSISNKRFVRKIGKMAICDYQKIKDSFKKMI